MIEAFEQQVREQKCQIKCGVAVPGDLTIQYHHARSGDHQILWAEVAVDQALARGGQPLRLGVKKIAKVRMAVASCKQVGVDAQLYEVRSGVELHTTAHRPLPAYN